MNRLRALDATFLYAEDGTSHLHIGSCAVFAGPAPSLADVRALIESKLHLVPRFRQKVRFVPASLAHPVWVDDPAFDLAHHVVSVRLQARARRALLDEMARVMSHELDRSRPLWRMWLVTGLAHGRWALVSKAHHCLADGISGTDLLAAILDRAPDAGIAAPVPWHPAPEPAGGALIADALRDAGARAVSGLRWSAGLLRSPRAWGVTAARCREGAAGLAAFARQASAPANAAWIPGRLGPRRRFAVARCDLGSAQHVRAELGGSVNDVALAAISGALRELLARTGPLDPAATLPSLVPVSVRSHDDHTAGNQVSMMFAPLPVGVADPLERFEAVRRTTATLKASHETAAGVVLFDLADALPAPAYELLVRATAAAFQRGAQHLVGTVTTNVAGPSVPLYALGREMVEYLPFVPLGPGVRVGIAIMSYNGKLAFGVTGDAGTPRTEGIDVDAVAASIEAGIADLVRCADARRRTAS